MALEHPNLNCSHHSFGRYSSFFRYMHGLITKWRPAVIRSCHFTIFLFWFGKQIDFYCIAKHSYNQELIWLNTNFSCNSCRLERRSTAQQILRRGWRIADSQCKTAWFQEEVDLLRTCFGVWLPSPGRQSSSSTESTGTIWEICPLSLRFFT